MKKNFEKLEIGCYYRNVKGRISGPINYSVGEIQPFRDTTTGHLFCEDGSYARPIPCEYDLIEKVNIVPCPMKPVEFEIEEGCRYIRRDGSISGEAEKNIFPSVFWPFYFDNKNYTKYGTVHPYGTVDHPYDLIAKYEEPKEKTLWKFKVGDFVAFQDKNNFYHGRIISLHSPIDVTRAKNNFNWRSYGVRISSEFVEWRIDENKLRLISKPIKLFVGAICELENGRQIMIDSYCADKDLFYHGRDFYSIDGLRWVSESHVIHIIKILNPKDEVK